MGHSEKCHRCGHHSPTWHVSSPLWNYVMRGNDIEGAPIYGDMVCPNCFVLCAEEAGVSTQWVLKAETNPEGLIYETPSGRIWDEEQMLWINKGGVILGQALRKAAEDRTAQIEAEERERKEDQAKLRSMQGWLSMIDSGVI